MESILIFSKAYIEYSHTLEVTNQNIFKSEILIFS
ncbi:MAG: hypothetical protein ACI86H_000471 [bacterium]|jgi:hypothetical protein